ncbi:MAG: L-lysine 6-transaminase [Candidatus Kapabacteria bacterium]|nr:L-lysine 6-transaminase [Candidatus Kapabacteria bacterium]
MKTCSNYKPRNYVEANDVIAELKKYMLIDGFDYVPDLFHSQVPYFVDIRDGKKYFDFFTCFASMPIGINHPKMMADDFVQYLGQVSINKLSNSDIYSEVMASFVKTFFEIAVPEYFKYSFFIEGGALAVENTLKAAFDWKVRKNFAKGYKYEKGSQIIHFEGAFHGRSGYTMSLTNTDPIKINYFPKFNWPRINSPFLHFPLNENELLRIQAEEKFSIDQIKTAFQQNKDDIAAIIIEPVQAEGGDRHFRKEFLQALRQLADENEALLIFDEVQTGVGLSGKWWAHQNFDVMPDIMSFGKKMQVCGLLAGKKLDEVPENVFHTPSRINSTWGGNLTDMARATRYLEIIEEEQLIENANQVGDYFIDKLNNLAAKYPTLISNPRGLGLLCAFDFPSKDIRNTIRDKAFKDGLFIIACGDRSIRFRPALNINCRQVDEGLDILENVIKSY